MFNKNTILTMPPFLQTEQRLATHRLYIDVLKRGLQIVSCDKDGDSFEIKAKYNIYVIDGYEIAGEVQEYYNSYMLGPK